MSRSRAAAPPAYGPRTASGTRPRRAVVADVAAPDALRTTAGRRTTSRPGWPAACGRFQLDPATVKVDWALTRPGPVGVPRRPPGPGTVHVADSVEEMTEAMGQVAAGAVPARAVPADGPDDDHRPDPVPRRDRVAVGLHARARRESLLDDAGRRASASPTRAGPDRAARAGLRAACPRPPGAGAARAGGAATPTCSAAPSTAAPASCTSSWSSGRCPGWAAPRPASPASTSVGLGPPRWRRARRAAARTPPGPPSSTTGSGGAVDDRRADGVRTPDDRVRRTAPPAPAVDGRPVAVGSRADRAGAGRAGAGAVLPGPGTSGCSPSPSSRAPSSAWT